VTNEFELIERIRARLGRRGNRVLRTLGDDAAIVRADGVVVTSVDAFVEGVHFRLATTSLRELGHKCLAASLSDLAAVGAVAGEAYIVLGLPPNIGEREVLELIEGAEQLATELDVTICGGDLTRSNELFVAMTVVGHARSEEDLVGRDGAQVGDAVGLTGRLGGAGAGLILLERKGHGLPVEVGERLLERQRRPRPLLATGSVLGRSPAHAMIDVSDGIASDASRIAEESGVELEIELARLPVDEGVEAVAEIAGLPAQQLAAAAGEDYELLFTAPADARAAIEAAVEETGTSVTWIGTVRAGSGVRLLGARGERVLLSGWDHFAHAGLAHSPRKGPASR
jgi:thiamine-monophosphate kinase